MNKLTIENTSGNTFPVAGHQLAPGSQIVVDAGDVTPGLKKYVLKVEETTPEPVQELSKIAEVQALSIGKATAEFENLSDDELNELEALENAQEQPRSGLLNAITVEKMERHSGDDADNTDTDAKD